VGRIIDRGYGQTRGVTLRQVNCGGLEEWKLERPKPGSEDMACVDYFPALEAALPRTQRAGAVFRRALDEQRLADGAGSDV
jgi:hypothetical protein